MFSIRILIATLAMVIIIVHSNVDYAMNTTTTTTATKTLKMIKLMSIEEDILQSCLHQSMAMMVNKTVDNEKQRCHCIGILMLKCIDNICANNETLQLYLNICNEPYDYGKKLNCQPLRNETWIDELSTKFCLHRSIPDSSTLLIIVVICLLSSFGCSSLTILCIASCVKFPKRIKWC